MTNKTPPQHNELELSLFGPGIDKTINEIVRTRRALRKRPGQIQLRAPIDGDVKDVKVALFDGARKL